MLMIYSWAFEHQSLKNYLYDPSTKMSDATKGRNLFHAKVKSVLSGDTLVLASLESGQERLFSLAFVSAPKLQRDREEVSQLNPPVPSSWSTV